MADREGLKAILGSSYCMNKKYVYSSASKLFNCNTHVKIKSTGLIHQEKLHLEWGGCCLWLTPVSLILRSEHCSVENPVACFKSVEIQLHKPVEYRTSGKKMLDIGRKWAATGQLFLDITSQLFAYGNGL